jgi:hypothetical protein
MLALPLLVCLATLIDSTGPTPAETELGRGRDSGTTVLTGSQLRCMNSKMNYVRRPQNGTKRDSMATMNRKDSSTEQTVTGTLRCTPRSLADAL